MPATGVSPGETRGNDAPVASSRRDLFKLSLAALGVVYGDIGTSPLYTIKQCFHAEHGLAVDHATVIGLLSLVFWALTLVIVVKYLTFVMRADNQGNGGIMALIALVEPVVRNAHAGKWTTRFWRMLIGLGLFATALLFGEALITPAISVLGAVEGLEVATHLFSPVVLPITVAILLGLFFVQSSGTGDIGKVFGPLMLAWFVTIAALGLPWILREPAVLQAVNPWRAVEFFATHGVAGFLILGSAILCITGGEALYADMGHFGRTPIRVAWYACAYPALILNYFGQGAFLLEQGAAGIANPFYMMAPQWLLYPLVGIATLAAVIASQALISGSFSLAQQAVALGYLPRLTILHTSSQAKGQIFVPLVNWGLMLGCLVLVFSFKTSSGLAAAYGLSVIGTMTTTSLLMYIVARRRWRWPKWKALALCGLFLAVDLPFLFANALKFFHGAWVTLMIGTAMFLVMSTWKKGRKVLQAAGPALPLDLFLDDVRRAETVRVDGTAVFMAGRSDGVPAVLLHHYKHNKVLHRQVVLLTLEVMNAPRVTLEERIEVKTLGQGFFRVLARYGFMESPNVPRIVLLCRDQGLTINPADTSYYLGRETILSSSDRTDLPRWRKRLFSLLSRNARSATAYFNLPPNRVVELGSQIEL